MNSDTKYILPGHRFLNIHWRGWLSILGSCGIYIAAGSVYLWGYIGQIVTSYFHYIGDKSVTESEATHMIPYGMLVMALLNPCGPLLFKFLNIKIIILLGMGIMVVSVFIGAHFVKKFWQFEVMWALCMNVGMALIYTSTMQSAW